MGALVSHRRAAILAALVAASALLLAVAWHASRGAKVGGGQTPTPATAQGAAATAAFTPPCETADLTLPASALADLRNRALHIASARYAFSPPSPDPANGKRLGIDIWLQTHASDNIARMHALPRFADDPFAQQ